MSFDRRVFVLLVALNALVTPLGVPYVKVLTSQSPAPSLLDRMPLPLALLVLVVGQALLAAPCAAIGLGLGPRLGLFTPILSRHARGAVALRIVRDAAIVGFVAGVVVVVLGALPGLNVDAELRRLARLPAAPPPWAGVLASFAAGVTEETTLRFGLFTLLVAVAGTFALRGRTPAPDEVPPPAVFHVANVVAALVFGALHFSNADVIGLPLTPAVVTGILVGNGVVGLACGWLYWKRGLEAAIVAHVAVDLVLHGLAPVFGR